MLGLAADDKEFEFAIPIPRENASFSLSQIGYISLRRLFM